MCGRFDVDARNPVIDELIKGLPQDEKKVKTGQVFPGEYVLSLINKDSKAYASALTWGFPKKDAKGLIINARAETAQQKYIFANALKNNPVAIPVTGFFEWHLNSQIQKKEKLIFSLPDRNIFYLAGFSRFFAEEPMPGRFVLLTTKANSSVEHYHSRMPVILEETDLLDWIIGKNLEYCLDKVPPELQVQPSA